MIKDKRYLVKRYRSFPYKRFHDKTVAVYDNLKDAQYESIALNRRDTGYRFYAMDDPHDWLEPTPEQIALAQGLTKSL